MEALPQNPEKSPKLSADKMQGACMLKDQTLKKTRTLRFTDRRPSPRHPRPPENHLMLFCLETLHENMRGRESAIVSIRGNNSKLQASLSPELVHCSWQDQTALEELNGCEGPLKKFPDGSLLWDFAALESLCLSPLTGCKQKSSTARKTGFPHFSGLSRIVHEKDSTGL